MAFIALMMLVNCIIIIYCMTTISYSEFKTFTIKSECKRHIFTGGLFVLAMITITKTSEAFIGWSLLALAELVLWIMCWDYGTYKDVKRKKMLILRQVAIFVCFFMCAVYALK